VKLALTLDTHEERDLIYAQQVGVRYVVGEPDAWDLASLRAMYNRVDKACLELLAVETLPPALYAHAVLGEPGRDAEIEAVQQIVRDMGAAKIRAISYRWAPPSVERTSDALQGRGGARVQGYDPALVARGVQAPPCVSADALWTNLAYFLDALLPVAAKAGVQLAAQPDNPPRADVAGVPRILVDEPALKRFLDLAPSPSHGLDLCTTALALMPDADVVGIIRRVARRGKLFMVRLGNVQPVGEGFRECFLDEGVVSMPRVLQALREVGYAGPVRAAPPPQVVGDTAWGHKGRAHDIGYLKAVWQVVEQLPR